MEVLSTDLLVIGSGLAGITSALEAESLGLQVLIVGKFSVGMGTNTSLADGFFTGANSSFSKEDHLRSTLEAGRGLNRLALAETLAETAPEAIERLKDFGVSLAERKIGYQVNQPDGSSQLRGVLLVRSLMERVKKSSIRLFPGLVIFDLVIEEGRARGGFGFFKNGKPCLVLAKAVILCAGGAGAIYRRNDNQKSILGDGYSLALRAGLSLFDLEFVQFFPLVIDEPRLSTLGLFPPYPEEARLFNDNEESLTEKLGIRGDLNQAVIDQRDLCSIRLYEISREGDIYFDLTQVPPERWSRYPLNFLIKSRFPFHERPLLVSPAVHFFMGGIEIDPAGKTSVLGLFGAGETAWGVHGANRFGGNALTECAVFGLLAARSAADYVLKKEDPYGSFDSDAEQVHKQWEKKAKEYMKKKKGVFNHPRDLLRNLKDLSWKVAGPVREEGSLKEGLSRLASLEGEIKRVYPETVRDLFMKRDLENTVLILKAILNGSLLRTESRGAFYRKDFQAQDDFQWLKHTCYRLVKGEMTISHRPCTAEDRERATAS